MWVVFTLGVLKLIKKSLKERESVGFVREMKHKRHQKDRRDKNAKHSASTATTHEIHHEREHHYHKERHQYKQYTMKDLSQRDSNDPKKLIIYIVRKEFFFVINRITI